MAPFAIGDSSLAADRKAHAQEMAALALATKEGDKSLDVLSTGPPSTVQGAAGEDGPGTPKKARGTTADEAGWLPAHRAIMAGNRHPGFVPLSAEIRAALSTAEAAFHLGRAAQTLRIWACRDNGPIRPLRICGRLAWKTDDLRRLLGMIPAGQIGGSA